MASPAAGAGNERPQPARSGKLFSVIGLIWEQAAQLQGPACYTQQLLAPRCPPPWCPHSISGPGGHLLPLPERTRQLPRERPALIATIQVHSRGAPQARPGYRAAAARSSPPHPLTVQAEPCPGLPLLLSVRSTQARSRDEK